MKLFLFSVFLLMASLAYGQQSGPQLGNGTTGPAYPPNGLAPCGDAAHVPGWTGVVWYCQAISGGAVPFAGVPTGVCTSAQTAINTLTGDYYSCKAGAWLKVGPAAVGNVLGYITTSQAMLCDGSTNDTAAFTTLLSLIGSTQAKIIVAGTQCLLSNLTIPANVALDFTAGGALKPVTGQTITILGPIVAPLQQIFFNALPSQGTIDFTGGYALDRVYPEWWGASPTANAAVNTPALQAAVYGAFGCGPTACRTNLNGNSKYNRELHLSGTYDINDELKWYHVLNFKVTGDGRLLSGIRQRQNNKRIIDGQSVAYGVFSDLTVSTDASQDTTHPLIDLDYDGSQGNDLRPQFVTFNRVGFVGGYVGVQIAKSGGGAQGSNIVCRDCNANSQTQAAWRIGLTGVYAFNSLDNAWYGGDIQSNAQNGLEGHGGNLIVKDVTFENGNPSQVGYDLYCDNPQTPCVYENVRSESLRMVFVRSAIIGMPGVRIINSNTTWQANQFAETNSLTSIAGSTSFVGELISGSGPGGDGAYYQVTNVGVFGGLGFTTATSGSSTTIVNSGANWTVNGFVGQQATIILGKGIGQYCVITGNTATTITCAAGWVTKYVPLVAIVDPDNTSQFVVEPNWGTGGSTVASGTVTFARMNFNAIDTQAATLEDVYVAGGYIVVGTPASFKNVTVSRPDWMSTANFLDDNSVFATYENITVVPPVFSASGALSAAHVPWSFHRNGPSYFTAGTFKEFGTVPIVWSAGQIGGGTPARDVWIGGRSDPQSTASVSRAILETGGTLGRPTPFGTDKAGTDLDIQGGLPTGAGTPGKINFWTGTAGGSSATVADGTVRWSIQPTGHLFAFADNTYDIGAAGANRPRNIFLANNFTLTGLIDNSGGSAGGACNGIIAGLKLPGSNTGVTTFGGNAVEICSSGIRTLNIDGSFGVFVERLNFGFNNSKGQHFVNQAALSDMAGTCTFSGTTCTVTFTTAYTATPSCTANDRTAAAPLQVAPTTTNVVITGGTGAGATDVINYICVGNPN